MKPISSPEGLRLGCALVFLGLGVVVVFCTPARCRAQVLYGSVVGHVTDSSGAAVPGATVHFSHVEPFDDWLPLTGDTFAIASTDSDALSGLANLKAIFEGDLDATATLSQAHRF